MFDKRYQVDRTFFTVKFFSNPVEAASRINMIKKYKKYLRNNLLADVYINLLVQRALDVSAGQARKILAGADRPTCHTDLCNTTIPVQQFMTHLPDPLRRHLWDRILPNQNSPLLPCSHMRPKRRKNDFQPRRRGALLTGVYLTAAAAVDSSLVRKRVFSYC
jgi:hypothetical protein